MNLSLTSWMNYELLIRLMGLYERTSVKCWTQSLAHRKHERFPRWLSGKESACQAGDMGSIPASGRSPGGRNDNPLQYSCLGNPMDRETWWTTVTERVTQMGVTKSQTQQQQIKTVITVLKQFSGFHSDQKERKVEDSVNHCPCSFFAVFQCVMHITLEVLGSLRKVLLPYYSHLLWRDGPIRYFSEAVDLPCSPTVCQ